MVLLVGLDDLLALRNIDRVKVRASHVTLIILITTTW